MISRTLATVMKSGETNFCDEIQLVHVFLHFVHEFIEFAWENTIKANPPSTVEQNEETLKRSSVETSLSIMDYYQHDMFSHLEDSRRISQYNLLHKESSRDGNEGDSLSVSISNTACCLQLY